MPKKLVIEDRVNDKTSKALNFDFFNHLCKTTGFYPSKIIIRRWEKGDDGNSKDKSQAHTIEDEITFLVLCRKGKIYTREYVDWTMAHEHRHLQQNLNEVLSKEIASLTRARAKRTYKTKEAYEFYENGEEDGIDWELVRKLVDWELMLYEMDAFIFASVVCGYLEPRRRYEP